MTTRRREDDFAYGDPRMHPEIPVCIRGSCQSQSLYAYGDSPVPLCMQGLFLITVCIWGSLHCNPCMHMGLSRDPRMHTGISSITIPVCMWGFTDTRMHTEIVLDHRMHMGIITFQSLYAYGDLCDAHMHMGIFQSHPVCLRKLFPHGKSSLISPYAKFPIQRLPYAYGDPHMHTGGDC